VNPTHREAAFRRVLRLLPLGYRALWEEDMVSAYLSSTEGSPPRSSGERLAVAWLALRLRLSGSHATPRAGFWYQLVLGIATLTTLYQGLGATIDVSTWAQLADPAKLGWPDDLIAWWLVAGLAWAATFGCLVLGRLGAARVLILVAVAHDIAPIWLDIHYSTGPTASIGFPPPSAAGWAWLTLALLAVFLAPTGLRLSRWWLAGYVIPALVIVITVAPPSGETPAWFEVLEVSLGMVLRFGTIIGMIVALVRAPRWLFPLAVVGAGMAAAELYAFRHVREMLLWESIDVIQLALAVACSAVGVVALRRLPRQT
jgi:hypothetical protein